MYLPISSRVESLGIRRLWADAQAAAGGHGFDAGPLTLADEACIFSQDEDAVAVEGIIDRALKFFEQNIFVH